MAWLCWKWKAKDHVMMKTLQLLKSSSAEKQTKPGQTDYLLREYKMWKQTSQIENERYHICVLIFRNNDLLYFLHGFCGQIQRSVGGEHHVTDGHW